MENVLFVRKLVMLEELTAMLFESRFNKRTDPIASLQNYAKYTRDMMETTQVPGVPEELSIALTEDFGAFFDRVETRLRRAAAGELPRENL